MHFIIIARDYQDPEALARRMAAREAHIALSDDAKRKGQQLYGVAMLNENGHMCGSVMIVDMPSREAVDDWLTMEPYVIGRVWEHIEVIPGKIGPTFESPISK
jgi:uncharacterized protein YciI